MSVNTPTVTDFKLNMDLERNANHHIVFLPYKDDRNTLKNIHANKI